MATTRKPLIYISHIKNEVGNWIEDMELIKNKFVLDFSQWFTSGRCHRTTLKPIHLLHKVTAAENFALIQPITNEEIQ